MSFLTNPKGYSPEDFKTYVETLHWPIWKPKYLVIHNTAEPNLAQWEHSSSELQRVINLNHYYKNEEHWHSGPHLFISPKLIWDACDLREDGVHASCFNSSSIGIEMVGDYSTESFNSGEGAKVRDLAVAASAILCHKLGFVPDKYVYNESGIHFHKECVHDRHNCPGQNVIKSDFVKRVVEYMKGL